MNNLIELEKMCELAYENEDKIKKSDMEPLEVFDKNEVYMGVAPRFLCHRLGLLHKVVYLVIENEDGRLLLQTRGDLKKRRFDLPVGGHMNVYDESPVSALRREMMEEIGLEVAECELEQICKYRRLSKENLKKPKEVNYEIRYVYRYFVNHDKQEEIIEKFKDRLEKDEVLEIRWFTIGEVISNNDMSNVADGLAATIPHYLFWKLRERK